MFTTTLVLALAAMAVASPSPVKRSGNRGYIRSEKVKGTCLTPLDESLADGTALEFKPCDQTYPHDDIPAYMRFEYGKKDGKDQVWVQDTDHCLTSANGEVVLGACSSENVGFGQGMWVGTWTENGDRKGKDCWEINDANRLVIAPCYDGIYHTKQMFEVMGI